MLIMGVDPGNYIMGYGLVDYNRESKDIIYIDHGFIRETKLKYPYTLRNQVDTLAEVIRAKGPDLIVLEGAKHSRGFVSQQRQVELIGCIKRVLVKRLMPFIEIPPSTMKKIITGNGHATKEEVARAMSDIFNLPFEDLVIVTYYKQGFKKGQIKSYIADGSDALGLAFAFPTYYSRVKEFDFSGYLDEH